MGTPCPPHDRRSGRTDTSEHTRTEHGQVLSSVIAVVAVVAVLIGLLVLFGTGGPSGGNELANPTAASPTGPQSASATMPEPTLPSNGQASQTPSPADAPTPTPTPTLTTSPPSSTPVASTPTAPATPTATATATARPTMTMTKTAQPKPVGPRPAVEIYNNTTTRGLAERVGDRARAAGWRVAGVDNWRGKVATSTVYYPLGWRDFATALAADIGVGRVKEALDNMKTDRLTVILTNDYSG